MYILDEYYAWTVANHLIKENGFELIQADEKSQEIWLKGTFNKKATVVRLFIKGFDWANHMKRDIAFVIERVRKIQKAFRGKEIDILNVYFAKYQPVDDWDNLKKPIILKDKKTITAKTFYIAEEHDRQGLVAFYNELSIVEPVLNPPSEEEEIALYIHNLKKTIISEHLERKREITSIFNYGKPVITFLLIAINIVMYFLLENAGGSTDTFNLIEWGAKFNPYIIEGEWYRIFSSMFLHIGLVHLLMNMLALYYLGVAVEKMFGSTKFLIIYTLSGLVGGLTSFAFNTSVAAGASGAIFGLFGSLLYFGFVNRKAFTQTIGSNLLFIIGLNIVLGFTVPNIDMHAHIGGLIGGFIASAVVQMPKKRNLGLQIGGFIVYLLMVGGLTVYGIEQNQVNVDSDAEHILAIQHLENKEYDQAIERLTRAIDHSPEKDEQMYFNRSVAYYYLQQWDKARDDLIEATTINKQFAEAHYNLALVYVELQDYKQAFNHAEKAVQLKPDNTQFQTVRNELKRFN